MLGKLHLRIHSITLLLCSSAVVVFLWGSVAAAEQHGADESRDKQQKALPASPKELVETVLLALAANDEKLGAVELKLTEVSVNVGVTETKTETVQIGELTIVSTQRPRTERTAHAVIGHDTLRYEYLDPAGTATRILVRNGNIWTDYEPKRRMATIRRPDQMAGIQPIDPRELAAFDIRRSLPLLLREGLVLEAGFAESDGKRICRVVGRTQAKGGQKYDMEFSPDVGMLPVRSRLYHPDGRILRTSEHTYQRIESREAWLLKSTVWKNFIVHGFPADRSGAAPSNDSAGEAKQTSTTQVSIIRILDAAEARQRMALNLPNDVRTQDYSTLTDAEK